MNILVLNCGSSSLKYQLIDMKDTTILAKGLCERIGIDGVLNHTAGNTEKIRLEIPMQNHDQAIAALMDQLLSGPRAVMKDISEISAVGHRVAHGGNYFTQSTIIDDTVLGAIKDCIPLAPLHNPAAVMGIEACTRIMGKDIRQVAVFDTAFHQTMPAVAYSYALPHELTEKHRIRRYGFHGTSHQYVAHLAADKMNKDLSALKIITCHLGNGSSISAVHHGKSVDTSMGFTPLEGLVMGTRCGSIDPAIIPFLVDAEQISNKEVDSMMSKQSGLFGISGISSDLRELEDAEMNGDVRAKTAIDVLCYQIKKYIGAYIAAMNGVDAIVFTAGIGENSALIRERALAELENLGISIDTEKNSVCRGVAADISAEDARVKVFIIPTNEELVIANDTLGLVS